MKQLIRSILPQKMINNSWHLPNAIIANLKYGFPGQKLKIIGVTGTDGKTTTTNMIYQILKDSGKKVSMVSTINAMIGGISIDTGLHVTSPDPNILQKFARQVIENKDEYLVLEVTSHAIDQFRFWGIKFDIGVITNITHEHLDYHKTFENYKKTKLKLIQNVSYAVVNNNIKIEPELKQNKKVYTFGLKQGDFNQTILKIKLKIPGDFNIENALAAFAVCSALGIDQNIIRKSLTSFNNLSGRMNEIKNSRGIKVIIDFAHTPNALENALKTLRNSDKAGKLIAVFGSAGKRDIKKRQLMGEVAAKRADYLVITAEDPRGEIEKISLQIADGAIKMHAVLDKNLFIINNRAEAINFAINKLSKKGDIIGIFGKGHETSMNLDGKKEIRWSEFEAVNKALHAKHKI